MHYSIIIEGPDPANTYELIISRDGRTIANSNHGLEGARKWAQVAKRNFEQSGHTVDLSTPDASGGRQEPPRVPQGTTPPPWHEILEVSATATMAEVSAAYRQKIAQYHPDRVVGLGPELRALAEVHSKRINVAYGEAKKSLKS